MIKLTNSILSKENAVITPRGPQRAKPVITNLNNLAVGGTSKEKVNAIALAKIEIAMVTQSLNFSYFNSVL